MLEQAATARHALSREALVAYRDLGRAIAAVGPTPCQVAQECDRWFADWTRADQAAALCAGCPVVDACLRYALVAREDGVWGGLNASDREHLRRERRATARRDAARAARDAGDRQPVTVGG
ncbi:WhiB family transcriptional regulator [Geodermatophilus sp. SYSU D00700]